MNETLRKGADLLVTRFKQQSDWMIMGLIVVLIGLTILFWNQSVHFMTVNNWINIGDRIALRGLIAIGLTILMISGGIDLSIAAVAAATGMIAAALINAGVAGTGAMLLALLCAMIVGGVNALIIVVLRINPLIATLGTLLLFRGLGFVVSAGENIVIGTQTWSYLGRGDVGIVPVKVIIFVAVLVAGLLFMRYSTLGNYLYAIGGNAEACRNVGVKVNRIRAGSYVGTSLLSGIAGITLMSQGGTALPSALDGGELEIIAAVLLGGVALTGGRGSLFGTLLGLVILGVIDNGMILTSVPAYWQWVVRGGILIAAVTLDSFRRGGGYR